jgi:hypothetical protein
LFVLPVDGMSPAVREDVARHRTEPIERVRPPIE